MNSLCAIFLDPQCKSPTLTLTRSGYGKSLVKTMCDVYKQYVIAAKSGSVEQRVGEKLLLLAR